MLEVNREDVFDVEGEEEEEVEVGGISSLSSSSAARRTEHSIPA